jgi:hypothetical protein
LSLYWENEHIINYRLLENWWKPIYKYQIEKGKKNIALVPDAWKWKYHKRLIWFFKFLNEVLSSQSNCLRVLVLLHPNVKPRRAKLYTRLNANQIDLNRSQNYAARKQSVESVFESFKPTIAITYMTSAPSLREVRLSYNVFSSSFL